jgi:hypothetical protein
MALRTASAPSERVLRPELREYAVSPTPTMQYLSLSPLMTTPSPSIPRRRAVTGRDDAI